jgi:hypothetical protein
MQIDPAVAALIDACGAVLFLSAALHKLRDPRHFQGVLLAYRLLPRWSVAAFALLIPLLEIVVAAGLLAAPWRIEAAAGALALLGAYAAAIAINLARGRRDLDCGCGAPQERRPIGLWMIWRNLILAAAFGCTLLPWSGRPLEVVDLITIAFGAVNCILIYLCVDRLLATASRVAAQRSPS